MQQTSSTIYSVAYHVVAPSLRLVMSITVHIVVLKYLGTENKINILAHSLAIHLSYNSHLVQYLLKLEKCFSLFSIIFHSSNHHKLNFNVPPGHAILNKKRWTSE